jgi:DNA-binding MarR family transcriptional regulator
MDRQKIELFRKNVRTIGILSDSHEKELALNNGVSLGQFHILFALSELKSCSMIELAGELSLDKSKISRAIDRLVRVGLVSREINSENRRYSVLTLTKQGKNIVRKIDNNHNRLFDNILSRLPEAKKKIFLESFDAFIKSFKEVLTS